MIQFSRRRSADFWAGVDPSYTLDVGQFIGMISSGFSTRPYLGTEALMELARKYPQDIRIAAMAARMAVWRTFEWVEIEHMLPEQLPEHLIYTQELVSCLGFERANRKWGIDEDQWYTYTGFAHRTITPGGRLIHGHLSYRPKGRRVFDIIEDIIAASIYAEVTGFGLRVDLDGDWWRYEEPFEDIFDEVFEFTHGDVVSSHFDSMRDYWLKASEAQAAEFACLKVGYYNEINYAINNYVASSFARPDDVGTIYLRGLDALRVDTILPPASLIWRELNWMARFVRERHILSDDPALTQMIKSSEPDVFDRAQQDFSLSVVSELQTYLTMTEAKLNWSCPSVAMVNAAQWSRNDRENVSQVNPVYRYLIL